MLNAPCLLTQWPDRVHQNRTPQALRGSHSEAVGRTSRGCRVPTLSAQFSLLLWFPYEKCVPATHKTFPVPLYHAIAPPGMGSLPLHLGSCYPLSRDKLKCHFPRISPPPLPKRGSSVCLVPFNYLTAPPGLVEGRGQAAGALQTADTRYMMFTK